LLADAADSAHCVRCLLIIHMYADHPYLLSFPTRRSSDLRTNCFPDLVLDQLAVGENTGNVVPALKKIAASYRKLISSQLNTFTKDRKSTRLNSSHVKISYAVFCLKKKKSHRRHRGHGHRP